MSVSVPLITDPNDHFLGTLPFVHTRARNEFLNSIRRAFDDTTGEQKSVRVMLHLSTRNGPTLMEMVANVVRNDSELLVILMGRAIESSLAGLLHHADNDADGTESQISSMTVSSMAAPSIPAYIPIPSGVYSYHEVHANEKTASHEDSTSLVRLRRQIAELSWGVRSQISSGTGILSLPCGIPSGSAFATRRRRRPRLRLSCASETCISSLTDIEWDENESKISSLTTPSGLSDGVGGESGLNATLITAPSGSAAVVSESNHDADTHDYGAHAERFRSVSDFGSIKEDDADDDGKGIVFLKIPSDCVLAKPLREVFSEAWASDEGPATESAAVDDRIQFDRRGCESNTSITFSSATSVSGPDGVQGASLERSESVTMRRSGNDELQRTGTPADPQLAQAYTALLRQQSRAEEQSYWDSDSDGTTTFPTQLALPNAI